MLDYVNSAVQWMNKKQNNLTEKAKVQKRIFTVIHH